MQVLAWVCRSSDKAKAGSPGNAFYRAIYRRSAHPNNSVTRAVSNDKWHQCLYLPLVNRILLRKMPQQKPFLLLELMELKATVMRSRSPKC